MLMYSSINQGQDVDRTECDSTHWLCRLLAPSLRIVVYDKRPGGIGAAESLFE